MEQGLRELLQPGLVLRQQLARGGLELDKLSPEQRKAKVGSCILDSTHSTYLESK